MNVGVVSIYMIMMTETRELDRKENSFKESPGHSNVQRLEREKPAKEVIKGWLGREVGNQESAVPGSQVNRVFQGGRE